MLWSFILVVLVFAAVLCGLALLNLPREYRHRQLWSPVAAILIAAALLYVQHASGTAREWARVMQEVDAVLSRARLQHAGIPAINLLLLAAWLALKAALHLPVRMGERWMGGFGVFPAYEDHPDQGVVLRPEWVYPGLLFRSAGWWVGGAFILLMIVSALLGTLPFAVPAFPALATLVLLEAGWYLGGILPAERAGGVEGEGVAPERVGDYTPLWEEYQQLWSDHLLAASASVQLAPTRSAPPTVHRRPGEGDEVQQAVTAAWHDLVAAGHPLSDIYYPVLDRLWREEDVLLSDAVYGAAAPVLFAFLHKVLVDGHTVLVLIPSTRRTDPVACERVAEWLQEGLHRGEDGEAAWAICHFGEFQQLNSRPDLLIAAPEEPLDRGVTQEEWFARVKVALVLEGAATVFEAPMRTDALMRVLRHHCPKKLQQVVLAGDRAALESAMRDNLALDPVEYRAPRHSPASAFAIVWSLEPLLPAEPPEQPLPPRFQDRVMIDPTVGDLGAEAVLALPAWRDQVSAIHLVDQEGLPWAEYVEELEKNRGSLLEPVPLAMLPGNAHKVVQVPCMPHLLPQRERAFVLARDRDCNLAVALRTWIPLGSQSAFVHVVSPPYLLRDYFAANIEYFVQAPVLAYSPRLAESRLAVAYSCLERLTTTRLTEEEVLSELHAVVPDARYVEDALTQLFLSELGIDPVELGLLTPQREHRFEENEEFREVVTYLLSAEIKDKIEALQWLRRYRIVDRGGHQLGGIDLDHLYQTYLPGQVHAFQGKPFKVEWVDHASAIVWVDHESSEAHPVYRPARVVSLTGVHPSETSAHGERQIEGGWDVDVAPCRGSFRVHTPQYYTFERNVGLTEESMRWTPLEEGLVPDREYADGRLLRLRITPPRALDGTTRDRVADTLAILFQEVFQTLYPETHAFLLACAPGSEGRWRGDPVQALMPLMGPEPASAAEASVPDARQGERPRTDPLVLYVFEDAHTPLGLTLSLSDKRRDVLYLLEDYLSWVLEDEERPDNGWRRPDAPRDRFLCYGMDAPHPVLDLEHTHAFLRGLQQHRNPLREARRSFLRGSRSPAAGTEPGTRQCDFCGRVLPAAEFDQFRDGRERCAECRATAVDSVPQLKKVYEEARRFLKDRRAPVRKDVKIVLGDAARVQEAAGRPFMPTAELDRRTAGVALRQGNRFSVVIENGQPHHRTLGTIVHELTRIWQYTHLDLKRMQEEHGLLLIEGLAQWAELTCVRGLAPDHYAQEESRTDVYGYGYRMIVDWEREHANLGNPFEILRHLYPAPKQK